MKILNLDFYLNSDVLDVGKNLLGKFIVTKIDDIVTGGMITETESYKGIEDKACHAYMGRKTSRNEAMFEKGGIAYIYLCYGMHSLLNVVTNKKDIPDAVLIRAIEPSVGIDLMLKRRNKTKLDRSVAAGPGSLTKALGITKKHNFAFLNSDLLWIEDRNIKISSRGILCSKRIGIDYAEEYIDKPWRFRIKDSKWTSLAK
ncbi:MAG: putative 3-methyladenine DNA glycosylase [Candidatus Anoxychlamydiales bacterium]|nr:putative 3-methyladenine DNA glycosylase [Candidatus Anoxychlamydiales bacterium]